MAPYRQREVNLLSITVPLATGLAGLLPIAFIHAADTDLSALNWAMNSVASGIHPDFRVITWLYWFSVFHDVAFVGGSGGENLSRKGLWRTP